MSCLIFLLFFVCAFVFYVCQTKKNCAFCVWFLFFFCFIFLKCMYVVPAPTLRPITQGPTNNPTPLPTYAPTTYSMCFFLYVLFVCLVCVFFLYNAKCATTRSFVCFCIQTYLQACVHNKLLSAKPRS